MLASQVFSILAILAVPALAQTAGNEQYASTSRSLLNRATPEKRADIGPLDIAPSSITFSVGADDNVRQFLSPIGPTHKNHTLKANWGLEGFVGETLAVSVITVNGEVTCDTLGSKISSYMSMDDVWDEAFMQALVLQSNGSYHVASDVAGCLNGWGGKLVIKSGDATSDLKDVGLAHVESGLIPPGPYIARIGSSVTLTEVYRVYRDENQAFTGALIPNTDGTFSELSLSVPGMNTLSIPVPSRLYTSELSNPLPLANRRVAVKDIFDIAGLKTGCGNRAYFNTYPARTEHSHAVQRLVDQGAILVGKAKTSSFANGESATADWVDQMCPFNPRADGYQQPSSSSSGPGAAIAAYDWLDNTIGSDTGCSILCPSSAQGVYGMRPTWGRLTLEGVMPMAPVMDTAGFFARDAALGRDFSKGWYGDLFDNYTSYPDTLIFPESDWTFPTGSEVEPTFTAFRQAITDFIKPSTIDNRTFEAFWNDTGSYAANGNESTSTFLASVWGTLVDYGQWTTFGLPWFNDYAAQNDGRIPFVAPSPNIRWGYGRVNLTESDYTEAMRRKEVYKNFVIDNVLVPDNTTCSRTIYLAPDNTGGTSYRNIYRNPPGNGFFSTGMESFMAGNPQMMIPIGQTPYYSTISNHTEYIPLTVTMYAAPGCDYMLWDLAADLQSAGILSPVTTGRTGFPL